MVEEYVDPLSAYAAACAIPARSEQWLVVTAGYSMAPNWLYPACAPRALEVLVSFAKIVPEKFRCIVGYMPIRLASDYRGDGPYPCILCGRGIAGHP